MKQEIPGAGPAFIAMVNTRGGGSCDIAEPVVEQTSWRFHVRSARRRGARIIISDGGVLIKSGGFRFRLVKNRIVSCLRHKQ
jgi:hypothetical protein